MAKSSSPETKQAKESGLKLLLPGRPRISVGSSTCNLAKGALLTFNALEYGLSSRGIDASLVKVGCNGMCHAEPVVTVHCPGKPLIVYGNVTAKDADRILDAVSSGTTCSDLVIGRVDKDCGLLSGELTYAENGSEKDHADIALLEKLDFFKNQHRVLLRNAGSIDPENIKEYIARGGYEALASCLAMKPADIIKEVTKSGLRGRGGGGFPTGRKWDMCRKAAGKQKYCICNVSEGEPGIGMHRSFLESDPHSVLEGIIIGCYAMGASTAYVYIRDNYRLALQRFQHAVREAQSLGLTGSDILGSGFSLEIRIKEGGGRFVCGEETALIHCIEGGIGEPRQRPPFPIEQGLFGKPTCINNVETWANIPVIMTKGSQWYAKIGSKGSKGTKVISLTGNVARTGLIEVDMGTSLKDIIYTIGAGIRNGKALKAIQTGGPSGGVLPSSMETLTVDYDELRSAGSMLGSGGMVVMDDNTDMVQIARYFTDFFVEESCGKCTPCREGMWRLTHMLDEILAGRADSSVLAALEDISQPIIQASACALGKTAPVPVLSTLKHFKADYMKYLQS